MIYLVHISTIIGVGAIVIISWGALLTFFRFVLLEVKRLRGTKTYHEKIILRHQFGSYLLLGLEFLIAADIILTITYPSLEEIGILASIVVIRTVISYFLDKEMAYSENKKCEDKT